ncbi:MAG: hypothetical protein R2789_04215 [Microthrixaceae bacterium]
MQRGGGRYQVAIHPAEHRLCDRSRLRAQLGQGAVAVVADLEVDLCDRVGAETAERSINIPISTP